VKGAMLVGTVFDVLKNLSALGNNTRKIGQLVAPWVRVENVKVIENDESFLWHKVSRF
jgi:predicted Zn-dependent protease